MLLLCNYALLYCQLQYVTNSRPIINERDDDDDDDDHKTDVAAACTGQQ